MTLRQVLTNKALTRTDAHRFALDEDPSAAPMLSAFPTERDAAANIGLLIGPEGGWTSDERKEFVAAGWKPVSLGPTILRAETAAIAGLAIVNAAWHAQK